MLALIMAGGEGRRLNLGEKPLVLINGRPMIAYVIDAFEKAGCEPVVVTSPRTPMTRNWCTAQGISCQPSSGNGFISDMVESVLATDEKKPLFVSVSDIPCVSAGRIKDINLLYWKSRKDACSTWVPASRAVDPGAMTCHERFDGTDAVPAGVNILLGERITVPQAELKILVEDPGLAINVNTRSDRIIAEDFLRTINGN